jgi:hypothetical protein
LETKITWYMKDHEKIEEKVKKLLEERDKDD